MGVLDDIGILNNKQLSKSAFSGFIIDLKKRLKTGNGIFKSPTIGKQADPIENFDLAKIEDQFLFPEFHRIWKERYTKTVQQLNLPSAYQAVPKIPLAPLVDPTALAKIMGVKDAKPVKFPDILFEIQGLPPPGAPPAPPATIKDVLTNNLVKTAEFFDQYLKGLNPLDPKIIEKLINAVNKAPGGIVPQLPDPRVLKHGYTQQHNFEKSIYLAQIKAHTELMARAADPTFLPNLIAQMASGQNDMLLTEVYAIASKHQPTPMSTSDFEIAAQEVLLQHQVKLECIALLGQNIGSGEIIRALAATPEDQGGLGLLDMSKSKSDQTSGNENPQGTTTASGGSTTTPSTTTLSGMPAQTGGNENVSQSPFAASGQPVQDEAPPGASGTGGSSSPSYGSGYGMGGETPADEYPPPPGASPGGSAQQPAGFGFGGPSDEVPPGGSQGQGSLGSGPQGSGGPATQQGSPFGFEAPPDEAPPPGAQGGGGNAQSNVSPWAGPLADDYPNQGNQGQATPPGWGGAPPDEGSQQQEPPKIPQESPEGGETMGAAIPTDPQGDPDVPIDPPPNTTSKDMQIPEGIGNSYSSGDDDSDEGDDGGSGSSKNSPGFKNTSVRKRIKDLIEGGKTCTGGCLGPAPDFSKMPSPPPGGGFIQGTFRGFTGSDSSVHPAWAKVIDGAGSTIGGGFSSVAEITSVMGKADPSNHTQPVATSCGQLSSWLVRNVIMTPSRANGPPVSISWDDQTAKDNFQKSGITSGVNGYDKKHSIGGTGFQFAYTAAALGAWVSLDNLDVTDPLKAPPPSYGDIFLTIDGEGTIRHTGIVIDWRPSDGWWATADAGQGNMGAAAGDPAKASQGMAYCKRILKFNGTKYLVTAEAAQAGSGQLKFFHGYVNMDIFVKKLKADYSGQWDKFGIPDWCK